ncbi:MAG: hypothetical protein ACK40G_15985 [Cytophagaceae bacterium]
MGTRIILPDDKIGKVEILCHLYKSIDCKTDKEIFCKILDMTTGTSIRSLKKYKKEFNWKRESHPQKQVPKIANLLITDNQKSKKYNWNIISKLDRLPREQKLTIIGKICYLFSTGEASLKTACDTFEIPTGLFLKWVNSDSTFFQLFSKAKKENEQNYAIIIESLASEHLLKLLKGFKRTTEQTFYEVIDNIDIPVKKVKNSMDCLPDVTVIKYANEYSSKLKDQNKAVFDKPLNDMSLEELILEEKNLLKDLGY